MGSDNAPHVVIMGMAAASTCLMPWAYALLPSSALLSNWTKFSADSLMCWASFDFVINVSYELSDFWQFWCVKVIFVHLWCHCHPLSSLLWRWLGSHVSSMSSQCLPFFGFWPSICFFFMMFFYHSDISSLSFSIISNMFFGPTIEQMYYKIYIHCSSINRITISFNL